MPAAAEPADDGQFTVTLSNASDTDTVIAYTVTGDATPDSDYTALTGIVTIMAGSTTATIDVAVIDDNLLEDNETVTVTLDSITSGDADITIGASNSDTVTISDDDNTVNTPPVVLDDTFTVIETAPNGTLIGIVTASDPDAGQTLSYSISSGDPTNVFAINPSSGEIRVNDSSQLDMLVTPSYTLLVEVTDDGGPPRTAAATITILVTDVNQPPVVSDQSFSIDENAAGGTSVGTVNFTDPDFLDTHTLSVSGGSGATAFAVDRVTGEITVADSSQLDYETSSSFTLHVVVTDNGLPNRSDSATITVNLNPLNDNVPIGVAESATVVFEDSVSLLDSKNTSVLDNDRDADVPADALTAILDSGPSHAASFTLHPDGTFLYVHNGSDGEVDRFTYHVFDGVHHGDPVTVTINIMPLNLPPDDGPPPDNDPPDDSDPPDDRPRSQRSAG